MQNQFVFGYGSLVNRNTHEYDSVAPARLVGWKRCWRHTNLRPVAFLTIVPDVTTTLDGLIMQVPHRNAELAQREHAYDRRDVTALTTQDHSDDIRIHTFAIPEGKHGQPNERHPILLSYLDVVVQGYFRAFGEYGVKRFFETTHGWDAPVFNDRADPQYPRHTILLPEEVALIDQWLTGLPAVMK